MARKLVPALFAVAILSALLAGDRPSLGQTPARVQPVDTERSSITVYVGKEGIFAFAGDNHQVHVPIASGLLTEDPTTLEVTVDAAKMQVLDPPSRRGKVQANMLGPQVLDVAKFPTIVYHSNSVRISPRPPREGSPSSFWTIEGTLTLHGQTHPVVVNAERLEAKRFTGSAIVKQTAFGITPIKVAAGSVRVKDNLRIVFDVTLK